MSSNRPQTAKAEARTLAQRERILAAAQSCFVDNGFHAASMAQIAETAGMSAGLIYRYFENKNAIILAIIENQLEVARGRIGKMHASNDLVAGILDHCRKRDEVDRNAMSASLFLEMSAEATRDPQIKEALSKFDATVRSEIGNWLAGSREEGGYGLPRKLADARALMLVCLIEGLKIREAREAELDRQMLRKAVEETVAALVARPDAPSGT